MRPGLSMSILSKTCLRWCCCCCRCCHYRLYRLGLLLLPRDKNVDFSNSHSGMFNWTSEIFAYTQKLGLLASHSVNPPASQPFIRLTAQPKWNELIDICMYIVRAFGRQIDGERGYCVRDRNNMAERKTDTKWRKTTARRKTLNRNGMWWEINNSNNNVNGVWVRYAEINVESELNCVYWFIRWTCRWLSRLYSIVSHHFRKVMKRFRPLFRTAFNKWPDTFYHFTYTSNVRVETISHTIPLPSL